MTDEPDGDTPSQGFWARLRGRLFHVYFLLRRPMTLGVRVVVFDEKANSVFLIRHTYVPGWHLPGGGVETGETFYQALVRETIEEGNIEFTARPALISLHFNRQASRRDHVALYLAKDFRQAAPRSPNFEIAESGFFPLDALPAETTRATRRRLREVFENAEPSAFW